jgi:hypothetical protein
MFRLLLLVYFFSVELLAQSENVAMQLTQIEQQENKTKAIKELNQLLNQQNLTSSQRISALLLQSRSYIALNDFEQAMLVSQRANDFAVEKQLLKQQATSRLRIP